METKQYLLIYWASSVVFVVLFLLILWKKIRYQLGPQMMMIKSMIPQKAKRPIVVVGIIPIILALCPLIFPLIVVGGIRNFFKKMFPGKKKPINLESEKISEEINIDFNIDEK